MPTTRRSTRSAAAKSTGKQSTLSFNNKVTKTGATKATAKELAATGRAATASKAATEVEASAITQPPSSAPAKEETTEPVVDHVEFSDYDDDDDDEKVSISPAQEQLERTTLHDKKPQAQAEAQDVSEKQVEKYWKGIQDAHIAKRVHQESLTLSEKVLRYFDISSQYGVSLKSKPFAAIDMVQAVYANYANACQPCTGISRMKRWQRAERLGLHPPIEVLAVLLKEERQGNADIEKSAIDRIMASTAIGSI